MEAEISTETLHSSTTLNISQSRRKRPSIFVLNDMRLKNLGELLTRIPGISNCHKEKNNVSHNYVYLNILLATCFGYVESNHQAT